MPIITPIIINDITITNVINPQGTDPVSSICGVCDGECDIVAVLDIFIFLLDEEGVADAVGEGVLVGVCEALGVFDSEIEPVFDEDCDFDEVIDIEDVLEPELVLELLVDGVLLIDVEFDIDELLERDIDGVTDALTDEEFDIDIEGESDGIGELLNEALCEALNEILIEPLIETLELDDDDLVIELVALLDGLVELDADIELEDVLLNFMEGKFVLEGVLDEDTLVLLVNDVEADTLLENSILGDSDTVDIDIEGVGE
mmetsp:Transcript_38018/g.65201  ORF Transcript_38018/g.65201 Transcript_38018/m.65201 type:complete len:259 (-) Transcript_38018:1021-1797(-)